MKAVAYSSDTCTCSANLPADNIYVFFWLLFCAATHYPLAGDAFMLPILPWEQKNKLQLHCLKNFFITTSKTYTKNIELWNVYGPAKGHGQPLNKLPALYISPR